MSTAHAAVKRELLVRYLDNWAPAALHGARRATYAEMSPGSDVVDALRVFAEFPELLAKHALHVVLAGELPTAATVPAGVVVQSVDGALLPHLAPARDGPLFIHLDLPGSDPPEPAELAELATGRATELLMVLDAGPGRGLLQAAGFACAVEVELVDEAGTGQQLLFGTGSAKHLAGFKEALWAVDEYAGVRYRDPLDDEHTLLDISLSPHVGPLKRALLARVRRGASTVAELRDYTVAETIYQAADANRVLTALLGNGALARSPERGRLTAETVIAPGRAAA